jgi:hypothetical protein
VYHKAEIEYTEPYDTDIDGSTNGFTKLNLIFEHRQNFNKRFTAILGASAGFSFVDNLKSDQNSFLEYGAGAKYYLGGNIERPRKDNYVFKGLHESELIATQFVMANIGLQINPFGSVIVTPHFNIATVGYGGFGDYMKDVFSPARILRTTMAVSLTRVSGFSRSMPLNACMMVQTENADVVIAGGVESMSNAEYYVNESRWGARFGSITLHDRLARARETISPEDRFGVISGMVETAENLAKQYEISREEQDEYSLRSHQRAVAAQESGRFDSQVVPV